MCSCIFSAIKPANSNTHKYIHCIPPTLTFGTVVCLFFSSVFPISAAMTVFSHAPSTNECSPLVSLACVYTVLSLQVFPSFLSQLHL